MSPIARKLGDFYQSALNTSKLDELKFAPLQDDFRVVGSLKSTAEAIKLMAHFFMSGKGGNVFHASVDPDEHNSVRYILQLGRVGWAFRIATIISPTSLPRSGPPTSHTSQRCFA